jgi:hypothetical protein
MCSSPPNKRCLDTVKNCCYTGLANFPALAAVVNFEHTTDTSNNSFNSD